MPTNGTHRRVLMISFPWPPMAGSASIRHAAIGDRLPAFGWEPIALTVRSWPGYARDPSLSSCAHALRADGPAVRRVLGRLGRLGRTLMFPDDKIGWVACALWRGLAAVRAGIDLVWSSSPPESAHLLGWALSRAARAPWVMDYGVEWADNPAHPYPSARHRALQARLETWCVRRATAAVTLSPRHHQDLEQRFGPGKFHTIPAGYDETRFAPAPPYGAGRFTILHAGSIFALRLPDSFVDALNGLVRQGEIPAERLRVRFVGNQWEGSEALARAGFPLERSGPVAFAAVPALLSQAHVLLITLTRDARCVVPNKLYEYLAVGRTVLAIVPRENPTGEIVRDLGAGAAPSPDDPAAVRGAILGLYRAWSRGEPLPAAPPARVRAYETRRSVERLAALFDRLISEPRP